VKTTLEAASKNLMETVNEDSSTCFHQRDSSDVFFRFETKHRTEKLRQRLDPQLAEWQGRSYLRRRRRQRKRTNRLLQTRLSGSQSHGTDITRKTCIDEFKDKILKTLFSRCAQLRSKNALQYWRQQENRTTYNRWFSMFVK